MIGCLYWKKLGEKLAMPQRLRSHPVSGESQPRYPGTFLLAVREALASQGWVIRSWLGNAIKCVDSIGREQVIGLENLFRRARQVDRAQWPELVVDFLQTSLEYGFDHLQVSRLICMIDKENQASMKVAQKIGMSFEREAVDETGPFLIYSRHKSDDDRRP
jgi:hypothetical protein